MQPIEITDTKKHVGDWIAVADDAPLPPGPAIVTLSRFKHEREALARRNSPLGVRLTGGESAENLAGDLERLDLIALEFASFTDGRPYSNARILRQRYSFKGEIRAVGQVLRDQIYFMLRCGFDGFAGNLESDTDGWAEAAAAEFDTPYQSAADQRVPAWAQRDSRRTG